jgi:hypothetical protein
MRAAKIIKTARPAITMPTMAPTESVEPPPLLLLTGVTVAVDEDVGEVVVDWVGVDSAGKY